MDPHMREHMIDMFFDMTDPSQSTVQAPSYSTEHKGRPTSRDKQNRRCILSFEDASTSGYMKRGSGVRNPPIRDTYIENYLCLCSIIFLTLLPFNLTVILDSGQ